MFVSFLTSSATSAVDAAQFVDSLPTDPASIVTLLLVVGAAGAVIWFGRPRGGGTP